MARIFIILSLLSITTTSLAGIAQPPVISPSPNNGPEIAVPLKMTFENFESTYNRQYSSEVERKNRKEIFRKNIERIIELNRSERGSAKYGINKFSDLSQDEFERMHTRCKHIPQSLKSTLIPDIKDLPLPESFDWREKNAVTEVKDQGSCGSCWAFSVIGNIEGLNAIKNGKLLNFSEQQLVDCDHYDQGCHGGGLQTPLVAIHEMGGLELEEDYPYVAIQNKCQFDSTKSRVRLAEDHYRLPQNETKMAQFIMQYGPVSVALNGRMMHSYSSGVAHPSVIECNPTILNHAVFITGFGVEKGDNNTVLPYWIIKNSWGEPWGEKGYYRLYRGDNTCGVITWAVSAILQHDE